MKFLQLTLLLFFFSCASDNYIQEIDLGNFWGNSCFVVPHELYLDTPPLDCEQELTIQNAVRAKAIGRRWHMQSDETHFDFRLNRDGSADGWIVYPNDNAEEEFLFSCKWCWFVHEGIISLKVSFTNVFLPYEGAGIDGLLSTGVLNNFLIEFDIYEIDCQDGDLQSWTIEGDLYSQ